MSTHNVNHSIKKSNDIEPLKRKVVNSELRKTISLKTVAEGVSFAELIKRLGLAEQLEKSDLEGIYCSEFSQVVETDTDNIE